MISDAKLTGNLSKGMAVARYMLDPDATVTDIDVKKLKKSSDHERILHIETDHALPVRFSDTPKSAAKHFLNQVKAWNRRNRPGQAPPQSNWEHRVVSFHPRDKQKVNAHKACKIAREALRSVATGDRPTLFVVHGDKEHLHVHLLYATVNEQGRIFNLHQDFRAWEHAMEALELKYDLVRVEKRKACADSNPDRLPDGTNPTKPESRMCGRTGEPSCKERLRKLIDEAIAECQSSPNGEKFSQFLTSLRKKNIGFSANIQSGGRVLGLRFHYGIFTKGGIKASALGRQYSWAQLAAKTGYSHDTKLHRSLLKIADFRVNEWTASKGTQFVEQLAKPASKVHLSEFTSAAPMASPEFPVEYPEWLKKYLTALAQSVNAEIADQQRLHQGLSMTINEISQRFLNTQTNHFNAFRNSKSATKKEPEVDAKPPAQEK
ncbi:relaxase/mobilization nuclease domain-containing protein [Endozoicomonas ascidiicola]|uniref:relaxase/mobilization nuclease domain-containing protein n=2 Tax=Endozoicomonas ascidiicola TaxID=1698521 RepID=UPI00082D2D76|nr:relaxase/mobilization nuclease domain-containing protein [Endozoicomonas ascidiicola]